MWLLGGVSSEGGGVMREEGDDGKGVRKEGVREGRGRAEEPPH